MYVYIYMYIDIIFKETNGTKTSPETVFFFQPNNPNNQQSASKYRTSPCNTLAFSDPTIS